MGKEKVLLYINNIRLVTHDSYNIRIERLVRSFDSDNKVFYQYWYFEGYFRSILGALDKIMTQSSWTDKTTVKGFETYLNEIVKNNRNFLLQ